MNNKKKIEEMTKDLYGIQTYATMEIYPCNQKQPNEIVAEHLIQKGWIKPDENSVVLTREELAEKYVSVAMYDLAKAFHDEKCAEFEKVCYDYHKLETRLAVKENDIGKLESEIDDLKTELKQGQKERAKEILDKVSRRYGGAWLVGLYKEYGLKVE